MSELDITLLLPADFTEEAFNKVLQQHWEANDLPSTVLCTMAQKRNFSKIDAQSFLIRRIKNLETKLGVEPPKFPIYESDFGKIDIEVKR